MRTLPTVMLQVLAPFAPLFSARVFAHVGVLVAGAILAPGKRTVASALRAMGLDQQSNFCRYHRVLSRAKWSATDASRVLLGLLVEAFAGEGPLVVGIDETLERRRGKKIAAKGIYRDPVRSSRKQLVKSSGLRWVCVTLLAEVRWAGRLTGVAILERSGPFTTLLLRAGHPPQADHRVGRPAIVVDPALAAVQRDRGRWRWWIRLPEAPRSLPYPKGADHLRHPPEARRRPLRSTPAPEARTAGQVP